MSDTLSDNAKEPMKQPSIDLSAAMENLSVTTDDSDKTSSSKNLSDMPLDVVGLIIERSEYKEQLILRKVSKSLRSLVDKQKPACSSLKVICNLEYVICEYNDYRVLYTLPENADYLSRYRRRVFNRMILRADTYKAAFDDLASTLKNPKLQLETFLFHSEEDNMLESEVAKYMKNVLKSINHQLLVKACEIDGSSLHNAFSIFSYFKPGVLEKITLSDDFYRAYYCNVAAIKSLSRLDQWKQAKELDLKCGFAHFRMRYATHFRRFQSKESDIYDNKLVKIRNWLAKRDNFEFCIIDTLYRFITPNDAREFCTAVGEQAPANERTEYVSHYSIPNSNDYLEFLFFEESVEIKKMKRSKSRF